MDEQKVPRVKMPPPNPVNSAGNSWAQSTSQRLDSPSNRAKYEDVKRLPPPPTSPSPMTLAIPMPMSKVRTQLQPAVPILPLSKEYRQEQQQQKNRAVTDPVTSNKTFEGRKLSIKSLRAKFAGEHNPNAIREDGKNEHQQNEMSASVSSSTANLIPPVISDKAARVVGYFPVSRDEKGSHHPQPPASAPPTTFASDPFHSSSESNASPSRQAQSTPVQSRPTRRWLKENGISSSLNENATPVMVNAQTPKSPPRNVNAMILGDGKLSPTKTGTYGLVSQVEIKEGFKRVASQQGIVESVLDEQEREEATGNYNQLAAPLTGSSTVSNPFAGQMDAPVPYLQPYSPSIYEGVWENDPNVVCIHISGSLGYLELANRYQGHTLPPFSPNRAPNRLGSSAEVQRSRDPSHGSDGTIQMAYDPRQNDVRRRSVYAPSFGSANSWAASGYVSTGNSFAQPSRRSSAIIPPLFAPENNNFVPPPPPSFPGFQASTGPVPPGIAQLGATLHHHIDTCFERLAKMIIDKSDKVVDELIGRCENLDDKLGKSIKAVLSELGDVKKEVSNLKDEALAGNKTGIELKASIKGLEDTLKSLEHKIEETVCQCQHPGYTEQEVGNQAFIGQHRNAQDSANALRYRNPANPQTTSSQRRTSNLSTPSTPYRRNQTNQPNSRRSNTLSGSEVIRQNEAYNSQDIRRSQFSDSGRTLAPEPDLNLHPAYAPLGLEYGMGGEPIGGMPLVLGGPGSVVYQLPSFRDGAWYQAARGAGRGYD